MEASDLMHGSGSRPFTDGLDFVFIHMDALSRNYITQEGDLGCEEMALLKVIIKLFFGQDAQNLVEVVGMLLFIPAIHKYVIKIHNNKLAYDQSKHLIHKPHEGARCISQAKWHNQPLIEDALGFEGRLPFIPFKDPVLIVATSKINFREDSGSMKLIK